MEAKWLEAFVQLGSFGLLCWMFWHTHNRSIPEREKAADANLAAARADFLKALQAERAESRAERVEFIRQMRAMSTAVNRLTIATVYHHAATRGEGADKLGSAQGLVDILIAEAEGWNDPGKPTDRRA